MNIPLKNKPKSWKRGGSFLYLPTNDQQANGTKYNKNIVEIEFTTVFNNKPFF